MEDTHDGHGLQRLHDLQTKFSTIETERDASVRRLHELENTEGGAVDDDAIDLLAKNVAELKMEQEKLARHIETEQEKLSNEFFKALELRAHHAGAQPSTPSSRATSSRTSRSSSIILPMSPVGLPPHHLSLHLLDSPPASATSSTTGRKRIIAPKRTESEAGSSTVAVEARSSSSSHNTT
jgi:hypothetical protein